MTPTKLTRRTAVRIATLFAGLFTLAMIVIFTVLYFVISSDLGEYVRDHVDEVQETMAAVGESGGRDALVAMVAKHAAVAQADEDVYLLTDEFGAYLAGNIRPIPRFDGWRTISWAELPLTGEWRATRKSTAVTGKWSRVKGGYLFIADSNSDVDDAQQILLDGLGWGVALTAIAAVLGGLILGLGTQRRVSAMETALDAVAQGQLGVRVPLSAAGDDLDHVAALINTTLERLQNLIVEVKQVTTDIAHDLKTPIGRIRQKLETVQSEAGDLQACRAAIGAALAEIDGVVGTFEALLRIAEIEAGARKAQFVELDLKTILIDVADALEPVAEDHGHTFERSLDGAAAAWVRGDRQLLNQLFVNLVENSIRHCPKGSRICVGLANEGTPVARISDNGPGIPAAERGMVFRRLYRLEKSRTTPGSGLGLNLVEAIAALHGATISLDDNHPGVVVTLRFANAADAG